MEDLGLYEEVVRLAKEGEPFALATVVESTGSSPRKAGAKMLVRRDGTTAGTVGGGRVEAEAIAAAVASMETGETLLLPFRLTPENGFVCGGSMTVYIEPQGRAPRLLVFGAGHVGKAVGGLAKNCGFHVTVTDDRPALANREHLPFADAVLPAPPAEAFDRLTVGGDTCIVIATAGHESDFAAVRGALGTTARFIGLLGSRRKKEALLAKLEEEGFPPEARQRVVTPVGTAIGAETPAEIAVSIVGELIRIRRVRDDERIGDRPRRGAVAADGEMQATPPA